MVSKNNFRNKQQQAADRTPHYGLRKLSIGVASVLLSTSLYMGVSATAKADSDVQAENAPTELSNDKGQNTSATGVESPVATQNNDSQVTSIASEKATDNKNGNLAQNTDQTGQAEKVDNTPSAAPTQNATVKAQNNAPSARLVPNNPHGNQTMADLNYKIIDDTTGNTLASGNLASGSLHDAVTISAEDQQHFDDKINGFLSQGYVLQRKDNIPTAFNDLNEIVKVHLAHGVAAVDSSTDFTKLPHYHEHSFIISQDRLTRTVHVNFTYRNISGNNSGHVSEFTGDLPGSQPNPDYAGSKMITRNVTLHGTAYLDLVTGLLTNAPVKDANGQDIVDTSKSSQVPTITWSTAYIDPVLPAEDGFHPEFKKYPQQIKVQVINSPVTPDIRHHRESDQIINICEHVLPNGSITNDGDPNDVTINRVIPYVGNHQVVTYQIIDDDASDPFAKVIAGGIYADGLYGDSISDTSTDAIKFHHQVDTFLKEGYQKADPYNEPKVPTSFDHKDGTYKRVQVHLVHTSQLIDQAHPGNPGQKIVADDPRPNAPTYSADTAADQLTHTVTRTIHYEGAGTTTPDVQQHVTFHGAGYIDRVTGHWIKGANDFTPVDGPTSWTSDDHPNSDGGNLAYVSTPKIPGYTAKPNRDADLQDVNSVEVHHDTLDYTVTVNYVANPQHIDYQIVDDTSGIILTTPTIKELVSGHSDNTVPATAQADLESIVNQYLSKGYKLVGNYTVPARFDHNDSDNQLITVHLTHATIEITPNTPVAPGEVINPNDPNGAKYPADVNQLTKLISRTIRFTGAGNQNPAAKTQWARFTATGYIDKVTGKWVKSATDLTTVNGPTWSGDVNLDAVDVPNIAGYHAHIDMDADGQNKVKAVTVNHNTNSYVVTVTYNGDAQEIDYQIVDDANGGATLANGALAWGEANKRVPVSAFTDLNTRVNQYLDQGYRLNGVYDVPTYFDNDVHDNQLVIVHLTHGTTQITPDHPHNVDPSLLTKDVTRTIHFSGAGSQTPADRTQTAHFTASGYIDNVTGHWVAGANDLHPVTGPTWTGDGNLDAINVPHINGYNVTIDRDSNADQTAVKAVTVDHSSNNYTVNVVYNATTQEIDYQVIDDAANSTLVSREPLLYGPSNSSAAEAQTYVDRIVHQYTNSGYKLVNVEGMPATFDADDSTNQLVTIHLTHGTTEVTPNHRGIPGTPINQDNPDGPKFPAGADQLTKDVTRTIHFTGAGAQTPRDVKQTAHFTATGYIDNVTGHWVAGADDLRPVDGPIWTGDGHLDAVTVPTIDGYHVVSISADDPSAVIAMLAARSEDLSHVHAVNVNRNTPDYTVTVTYDGDVQHIDYQVIDDDRNGQVIDSGNLEDGKSNETVPAEATTKWNNIIHDFTNKGYVVVGTPDGVPATFDAIDNVDQTVTVHLNHKTTTVTPDHPHHNTDPLPDNPDHHYPNGVDHDDLNKTVTRTINLHMPDGSVRSIVQPAHLTRSATVDEATGTVISYTDWTTSNWPEFDVPTINGYTASMNKVNAENVDVNTNDTVVDIYYNAVPTPDNPQPNKPGNQDKPGTPGNQNGNNNQNGNGSHTTNITSQPSVTTDQNNNQSKKAQTLPQTGNNDSASLIELGMVGMITMLGLGYRRRKD